MLRMLRIDLEKMFGNYRFYVAVVGIALGLCLHALSDLMNGGGRSGAEELFTGVKGHGMTLLSFMLCVVGGALNFCEEQKNGNFRMAIQRSGLRSYVAAKIVSAMIGGFFVMVLGNLLSVGGMALMILVNYRGAFPAFVWGEQMAAVLLYTAGQGFLGALLSVVGLTVTTILPNYFVGMAAPILFYYLWQSLDAWFHFPDYWLDLGCYFIFYPQVWKSWQWQLFYALFFTCACAALLALFCRRMIRRRLEND